MEIKIPFLLDTDSYKAGHFQMYPAAQEMIAYFTCRGPLSPEDQRIVYYGGKYLFDTVLSRQITMDDIHEADAYLGTHGVQKTPYVWPRDLWVSVVEECDGYLPFRVRMLRDGSVVYPQVPCFTITAIGKYARLVTWFETQLMRIWSPITTATKSRQVWDGLRAAFDESVDEGFDYLLASRLHDFGSRGVSSAETAMVTGSAHLLSFEGTDTMIAGWLATLYNGGEPIGESVLASEHSVMTAWDSELDAVKRLIEITPEDAILSVVADSYGYSRFLWQYLPIIAPLAKAKNLLFVVRPDSGDPVHCVLEGLRACEDAFGCTVNSKGFKVLNGAAVIQGDGIDSAIIHKITGEVLNNEYSIQNVAFGMGGGLLQRQNRDTLKVAIKLCRIVHEDGRVRDVMKAPSDDLDKMSLPGDFAVVRGLRGQGIPHVYPQETFASRGREIDELECVWDCGPTEYEFDLFSDWRDRLNQQWAEAPKIAEARSPQMRAKMREVKRAILER